MMDYITPLEELMALLSPAVQDRKYLTDEQIRLGNKLLVYIRYDYVYHCSISAIHYISLKCP